MRSILAPGARNRRVPGSAASAGRALAICALALGLLAAPGGRAVANGLSVSEAWSRPTLPDRPSAAYLNIANDGAADDRLLGARSPAFGTIELHETVREGGVASMRQLEALPVPAGGRTTLEPGAQHLMLFDPARPLAEGESYPITLDFEGAGEIEATVEVRSATPGGSGQHEGQHEH